MKNKIVKILLEMVKSWPFQISNKEASITSDTRRGRGVGKSGNDSYINSNYMKETLKIIVLAGHPVWMPTKDLTYEKEFIIKIYIE